MNKHEKHIIIGRLVLERANSNNDLNLLLSEAYRIGCQLSTLAQKLRESSMDEIEDFLVDCENISKICTEIRQHKETIQRIDETLKKAGL